MHPYVKTHHEKPKIELYTEPYQQPISTTQLYAYYKESKAEPEPYQLLFRITFPNFNINLRISNSLIAEVA
jgi:hypothetical protein